jgi:hypothetical protein
MAEENKCGEIMQWTLFHFEFYGMRMFMPNGADVLSTGDAI